MSTARQKAEVAVRGWTDQALKAMPQHVPSSTPADEASGRWVSVEWLAWMFSYVYCEGALGSAHPELDLMEMLRNPE
jgi:hypothetical protein